MRRYGSLILLVEMMGFTAMLPYVLLCVHGHYPRNPGSLGLPAAGRSPAGPEYRFNLHVIVPCYKEKLDMVQCTVIAAMTADLPPGTTRTVYMCDDGKDPEKRAWALELEDRGLVYVTGRKRIEGGRLRGTAAWRCCCCGGWRGSGHGLLVSGSLQRCCSRSCCARGILAQAA